PAGLIEAGERRALEHDGAGRNDALHDVLEVEGALNVDGHGAARAGERVDGRDREERRAAGGARGRGSGEQQQSKQCEEGGHRGGPSMATLRKRHAWNDCHVLEGFFSGMGVRTRGFHTFGARVASRHSPSPYFSMRYRKVSRDTASRRAALV